MTTKDRQKCKHNDLQEEGYDYDRPTAYPYKIQGYKWCDDCRTFVREQNIEQEKTEVDNETKLAISIAISEADVDGIPKATEDVIDIIESSGYVDIDEVIEHLEALQVLVSDGTPVATLQEAVWSLEAKFKNNNKSNE